VLVDDFQIRVRGDGPIRHKEGYVSRNIVMASRSGGRPLNAPHPGPGGAAVYPGRRGQRVDAAGKKPASGHLITARFDAPSAFVEASEVPVLN